MKQTPINEQTFIQNARCGNTDGKLFHVKQILRNTHFIQVSDLDAVNLIANFIQAHIKKYACNIKHEALKHEAMAEKCFT